MAAVDYERAWFALKAKIATKRSWGADQVAVAMSEVEVECLVPEGEQGYDLLPVRPRAARAEHAV